jgi:hypothetical protein
MSKASNTPLDDPLEQLVDTEEAGIIGDLSVSYLNKLRVRDEGPPYYKFGRAVRYKVGDLVRWREQFKVATTSKPFHPNSVRRGG